MFACKSHIKSLLTSLQNLGICTFVCGISEDLVRQKFPKLKISAFVPFSSNWKIPSLVDFARIYWGRQTYLSGSDQKKKCAVEDMKNSSCLSQHKILKDWGLWKSSVLRIFRSDTPTHIEFRTPQFWGFTN